MARRPVIGITTYLTLARFGVWEDDAALMAKWRRKVTDVHHLTGHLMAGHDAFVTSDHDDMIKKRADLRARTGIVVVSPAEAVQMAHGQAA